MNDETSRYKPPADFNQRNKRNIERLNSGDRKDMAMAIITEATLVEQPKKTELEYRVIAVNKAGEGQASNTVMVVL